MKLLCGLALLVCAMSQVEGFNFGCNSMDIKDTNVVAEPANTFPFNFTCEMINKDEVDSKCGFECLILLHRVLGAKAVLRVFYS
mgnify:CR=1 FL=1